MNDVLPTKKRDRTRNRLLIATQELLLERNAGSLSIRDITTHADVVHSTFYNYFDSVEALIESVGLLFYAVHAQLIQRLTTDVIDTAEIFALSTRQTMRFIAQSPAYGRFLFDAGLPIDKFITGLRYSLRLDIEQGQKQGRFVVNDIELTVSMVTGSLLGLALDLHRHLLPATAIETATCRLLEMLGIPADEALRVAHLDAEFLAPPQPPLMWIAVEATESGLPA
jgi:AcrR family transcriptional regulator